MEETRYYVEAGWDPVLHIYYGQVWATIDPVTGELPDDPVLWVGTRDEQAAPSASCAWPSGCTRHCRMRTS